MTAESTVTPAPAPLAMKVFVASDAITFVALWVVAALVSPSAGSDPGPSVGMGAAMTSCLLAVSASFALGARSARPRLASLVAAVLGMAFLAMTAIEYRELFAAGLSPQRSLAAASFLLLTGFHAAHVVAGVVLATRRALFVGPVEATALYWHFVDGIWVVIFVGLYL
ncbi:MAG: cytochrome c oxidase subunit 3 [Deltaproteobacteria bacterium]|jgi:nitric oxide reductase NorE protein|nr:cytochrome c oxidase subunit 3 [Deltaproteobacteria bacterium]